MNNLIKNHAWYRALKVLYIFALLLTCLFSVRYIYINKKPKEVYDKTAIQCYNGKVYMINEKNCEYESINFNFDDRSVFLINRLCETGQACNGSNQSLGERTLEFIKINKEIKENPPIKLFNFKLKTLSSWTNVITFSILSIILIIIIFELIRRIFYYIMFGKFIIKNFTKK